MLCTNKLKPEPAGYLDVTDAEITPTFLETTTRDNPPITGLLKEKPEYLLDLQSAHQCCQISTSVTIDSQELLAALLGIIQPLIETYTASNSSKAQGSVNQGFNRDKEGQRFLDAVEGFIAAKVKNKVEVTNSLEEEKDEVGTNDDLVHSEPLIEDEEHLSLDELQSPLESDLILDCSNPDTPIDDLQSPLGRAPILDDAIPTAIIKVLRPHVFNKMPIRIIAFDKNGTGMQLIERGEMFGMIFKSACAGAMDENFQTAWWDAEDLANSPPFGFQEAMKRQSKLIEDLIEYHARYSILSHTWIRDTPGDLIYKDWSTREANPRGYAKLANFCRVSARDHGVSFGWMDNICINKDSSSELDESIRSMYKWYRAAYICVTYLAETVMLEDMKHDSWFTRGWTLQELLAPHQVRFYDMHWDDMLLERENPLDLPFFPQSISEAELHQKIYEVTSITEDELLQFRQGETEGVPISRRLELAADREVTREEDCAYSLMGLLGVDISVAYGEGSERAFFRLLRELLGVKKQVLDIFNHGYWQRDNVSLLPQTLAQYKMRSATRIPALSPEEISAQLSQWQPLEPVVLTHLGVRVPLLLVPGLKTLSTPEVLPDEAKLNERFAPRGTFYGNIALYMWEDEGEAVSPMVYFNLLDDRIYECGGPSSFHAVGVQERARTLAFGVMNFSADNTDIVLPQWCFSVLLDCGTIQPGNVQSSDNVRVIQTRTAPIFELKSAGNTNRIPRDELGKHGIQLVTLYL